MPDRLGLPAVLAEIVQVAGIDVARVLAAEKGGQEVDIPAEAREGHWLTELVGMPAARKLCNYFRSQGPGGRARGVRLVIPMGNVRTMQLMVRAIEAGGKNSQIAAMTGRHERTVRRIKAKLKDEGLGPLFD